MVMNWKSLAGAVAVVLAAVLLLPSTNQGWQSVCACVSPRESFELFVRGNAKTQITDDVILSAFANSFPVGTPASDIQARAVSQKQDCLLKSGTTLTCTYWLEFNKSLEQERGYELEFSLGPSDLVSARPALRAALRPLQRG